MFVLFNCTKDYCSRFERSVTNVWQSKKTDIFFSANELLNAIVLLLLVRKCERFIYWILHCFEFKQSFPFQLHNPQCF